MINSGASERSDQCSVKACLNFSVQSGFHRTVILPAASASEVQLYGATYIRLLLSLPLSKFKYF